MSISLLRDALTDASAEGYSAVGVSGGEPLLYKPLYQLLEHAHQSGMKTTVTSNGMLLTEKRLEVLRGVVDLLAISLDGVPTSHNRMRASEHAFETMVARLEGVRQSGIPFGFIFTLTQHNLHELEWVANFALEHRAKLLQVHPLEEVGRARTHLAGSTPDTLESAYASLEVQRIRALVQDRLYVQLDLTSQTFLRAHPELVYADVSLPGKTDCLLADLVSPLVIEPDGMVVPLQHGFSRAFALGNLHEAPLHTLALTWRQAQYQAFQALCWRVFQKVTAPAALPFINWYELIGHEAEHIAVG